MKSRCAISLAYALIYKIIICDDSVGIESTFNRPFYKLDCQVRLVLAESKRRLNEIVREPTRSKAR